MSQKNEERSVQEPSIDYQVENKKLYEQLTKKNSDYFFKLNRQLTEADIDAEVKDQYLYSMMTEAVDKQAEGITAKHLYGTVYQQVDHILHGPAEDEQDQKEVKLSPDWQLYVDGALLVGGVFAILSGMSEAISDNNISQLGLISMIANYLIGGLVMLAISKTAPRPGMKNNYWIYFGASIGSIALWGVIAALINLYVPAAINTPIPPALSLPIGVISLLLKWWFKRKFQVVGGMF